MSAYLQQCPTLTIAKSNAYEIMCNFLTVNRNNNLGYKSGIFDFISYFLQGYKS
jgi:hypothetical protein